MSKISKLSIADLELDGKRLFVRVDFNVPLKGGRVVEDTRIRETLPTIEMAVKKRARVVLASHLGRPGGKRQEEFSLRPVAHHLSSLMSQEVGFVDDCVGREVENRIEKLDPERVLLLENVRFYEGETKNDLEFARRLGGWADEYVNDAFGAAHRAHASTVGVAQILGRGAAGLLMERELEHLSRILHDPQRPVLAILGGAKVSEKIDVIRSLLNLADTILVGGGMLFTFLKAQRKNVGKSIVEKDKLEVARELMKEAESKQVRLCFPSDLVIAPKCEPGVPTQTVDADKIPDDWMGLDIGPRAVEDFQKEIETARTIIWNGPLGVFEIEKFASGTLAIARAVASSGAFSVVGGGDSVSAVVRAGVQDRITHISTGGGASLEFLAGKTLPGVEILTDRGN